MTADLQKCFWRRIRSESTSAKNPVRLARTARAFSERPSWKPGYTTPPTPRRAAAVPTSTCRSIRQDNAPVTTGEPRGRGGGESLRSLDLRFTLLQISAAPLWSYRRASVPFPRGRETSVWAHKVCKRRLAYITGHADAVDRA